jgi:hypothetical protein
VEIESVEHRRAARVAEAHVLEPHVAADRRERHRVGPLLDPRVRVEDVEDALCTGPSLLTDGEQPREHAHRGHELHQIGGEREERPQRDVPFDREPPAQGEHTHLAVARNRLERRGVPGLEADEPAPRRVELPGGVGEVIELASLLAEALHDPDPGHGLVDDPRDLAGALLRVPGGREHGAAHPYGHHEQQRDREQHHQRQRR